MLGFLKDLLSSKKHFVKFYKGDYSDRQKQANADGAICYIEHHFNSSSAKDPTTADYAVVIVGKNASKTSIYWGQIYSRLIDEEFEEIKTVGGVNGVLIGGYGGRGDGNIRLTNMPAILVEPMFCNDPDHAKIIRSAEGQDRLARVLAFSIQKAFPNGGLVAFSVGHKYKRSNPNDMGADVVGGGSEAEFAEQVLLKAKEFLEG